MSEISMRPAAGIVVIRAGGAIIAETNRAVVLNEEGHDPVFYIPRDDVGMAFLDPSETRTTCPKKGEARHFHLIAKSGPIHDAAWSYENPMEDVAEIAGMIAFYPEKTTIEQV